MVSLRRHFVPNPVLSHSTDFRVKRRTPLSLHTSYDTGIKVSDEELAKVKLTPLEFHGDWNYTIRPHKSKN